MDSASVGFSLILRASSFSNSYDAVLAVIYLGILSIFFFPPLRGGAGRGFSMSDKVAVLKEHVLSTIAWCGNDERKGILHSRRHFAASPVFKGLPDFKQTRIALLRAETIEEVFAIMDSIVTQWGNGNG